MVLLKISMFETLTNGIGNAQRSLKYQIVSDYD